MGNTQRVLTIENHLNNQNVLLIVNPGTMNCCDLPTGFDVIGGIEYGSSATMPYVKKSGHGCDGRQGQFAFDVYINSMYQCTQPFDFDSGGSMELSSDNPKGFVNKLTYDASGNPIWGLYSI